MPDFHATRKSGIKKISVQIFFLLPVFYTFSAVVSLNRIPSNLSFLPLRTWAA
jgi:hypothetical protein